MGKLIECIPNISEGRNREIIKELAQTIEESEGVRLLNTDSNEAANRTVFTFVGEADKVFEAAGRLVAKASELIDMSKHSGEHPRIGAVDVCPFVPISGINLGGLTSMVEKFAEQTAELNGIPIYMYEKNAKWEHRKRLEQIRKGEYEGLVEKIKMKEWKPDYGAAEFNAKFGAMVTGVRNFLIAYNINLDTKDTGIAKRIAEQIRQSGKNETVNGEKRNIPGIFTDLKAIGWYISDFGCAQVSTNITNMQTTPIYEVFETVKRLAKLEGVETKGSELIGMIPYIAMETAGNYYAKGKGIREQILEVTERLGLNSVKKFEPNDQILEIKAGWMGKL